VARLWAVIGSIAGVLAGREWCSGKICPYGPLSAATFLFAGGWVRAPPVPVSTSAIADGPMVSGAEASFPVVQLLHASHVCRRASPSIGVRPAKTHVRSEQLPVIGVGPGVRVSHCRPVGPRPAGGVIAAPTPWLGDEVIDLVGTGPGFGRVGLPSVSSVASTVPTRRRVVVCRPLRLWQRGCRWGE